MNTIESDMTTNYVYKLYNTITGIAGYLGVSPAKKFAVFYLYKDESYYIGLITIFIQMQFMKEE